MILVRRRLRSLAVCDGTDTNPVTRFDGLNPLQIRASCPFGDTVIQFLGVLLSRSFRSFSRFVAKEQGGASSDEQHPERQTDSLILVH